MLKDRSGIAADAAGHCQVDGNNCDHVGIKVRISVLECTVSQGYPTAIFGKISVRKTI